MTLLNIKLSNLKKICLLIKFIYKHYEIQDIIDCFLGDMPLHVYT